MWKSLLAWVVFAFSASSFARTEENPHADFEKEVAAAEETANALYQEILQYYSDSFDGRSDDLYRAHNLEAAQRAWLEFRHQWNGVNYIMKSMNTATCTTMLNSPAGWRRPGDISSDCANTLHDPLSNTERKKHQPITFLQDK